MANRVGQQLGNYRLIRHLGRGGFADVYLGQHLRLGTQAAIKVLHTQLASHDDVEEFEKEAWMIAHLRHPHIVRVLDYNVEEDTPFLAMDYAVGGSLRRRHPTGTRLPFPTIISYVKQIADALQYAHDQRIIHRDVKPENMLIGEHDTLLLSDFGIAIAAQSSRYQNTQDMSGTMAYMAPEQIQGHPRPASDQYALGIVVYEWLSGNSPFHGSMTEIIAQHLAVQPPLLQETLPSIPSNIEQVVLMALEKDPRKRFQSVKEFATALEQASQNMPISLELSSVPWLSSTSEIAAGKQVLQRGLPVAKMAPVPGRSRSRSLVKPSWKVPILVTSIIVASALLTAALLSTGIVNPELVRIPLSALIATPTPTPTRITLITNLYPKPGTILYQADWSRGLNGWVGTSDWNILNGMLHDDGSYYPSAAAGPTIVAPFLPDTADYAVEARVQKIGGACFDPVTFRGNQETNGWHGYKVTVCEKSIGLYRDDLNLNNKIATASFDPGNGWHLYRVEAKGPQIKVFIDGKLVLKGNDNSYLSTGQLGIKSSAQLIVSSFKIITL
jgi:serine/threonine protein kinase